MEPMESMEPSELPFDLEKVPEQERGHIKELMTPRGQRVLALELNRRDPFGAPEIAFVRIARKYGMVDGSNRIVSTVPRQPETEPEPRALTKKRPRGVGERDYLIGRRIMVQRVWAGMRLEDVAPLIGVSPSAMSRIENGLRPLRITELERLADGLDVEPAYLLRGRRPG